MATKSITDNLVSNIASSPARQDNFAISNSKNQSNLQKILNGFDQYVNSNKDAFIKSDEYSYFNYTRGQGGITKADKGAQSLIDSADKKLSFDITTKQGDTVTVKLLVGKSDENDNTQIAVEFETEGNISDQEKEEISKTISEIGSLADSFLNNSENVRFDMLSNIDSSILSGVKISAAHGIDELKLAYSIDNKNEKQSLSLDMSSATNSGKFDITTGFGKSDAADVQNYLAQIDKATQNSYQGESAKTGSAISSIYRDGLSTMFNLGEKLAKAAGKLNDKIVNPLSTAQNIFGTLVKSDARYQGLADKDKAVINEGVKNVVDFSAKFIAGDGGKVTKTHNENQDYATGNGFTLEMKQSTKVGVDGNIDQDVRIKLETANSNFKKQEASKIDETYKISVEKYDGNTKVNQSRERSSFNFSNTNLGFGESRKRLSRLNDTASSSVVVGHRTFSEEKSNTSKGIVYDAVMLGKKKLYEDSREVNESHSSKRIYTTV